MNSKHNMTSKLLFPSLRKSKDMRLENRFVQHISDISALLFHHYFKTGGKRGKSGKWKYSHFLQVIVFRNCLTYERDIIIMVFLIIP